MPEPLPSGAEPWTDTETARLTKLHGQGKSLNAIATEMGRAKATISKYAAQAGLSFDRSRTAKAAEAVHIDNKARRVGIVARVYTQVEAELTGLEQASAGWRTILKGEYGVENEVTLTFAPPTDRRSVADIINRHLVSATKLEALDAGQQANGVRDLLTGLADRFGITDAS